MDQIEKRVRRWILRPLKRRAQKFVESIDLDASLERIDDVAFGQESISRLREVVALSSQKQPSPSKIDAEHITKVVALIKALFQARRINTQQYVFQADIFIEKVHSSRISAGYYDVLNQISSKIDAIQKRHGLKPGEYWLIGDGPKSYQILNKKYEAALEEAFITCLSEFKLEDLADLKKRDPAEYSRLRERGRRSEVHKTEDSFAIKDFIMRFEEDAHKAASAGAYSAAVVALVACLEALLLLRCVQSKSKAEAVSKKLPKRIRPSNPKDPSTWKFETLIEVNHAANWFPVISTDAGKYNPAALAHFLRGMRNHVHPGRQIKESPWLEIEQRDYNDAFAVYSVLAEKFIKSHKKSSLKEKQPSQNLFHFAK